MASQIKSYLFGSGATSTPIDVGLLVLRVFAGLAMAFAHGLGKIPPSEGFQGAVEGLGFPLPGLFAWMAGLTEFFGGLLIAVGLATRPAALLLLFTMLVAAFGQHAGDPFGEREMALLYASIAAALIATGAGRFSIDALIHDREDKRIWR